jgi:Protein of unknown function (DUF4435)
MSMLDVHITALNNNVSIYHEFLSRYSKIKKVVYGFVEGKEDPCFYRGFLEHAIPDDWNIELWAAGNKKQVYKIYNDIDWRSFPKTRICFFVDRDLSDLIPEKFICDKNIYVTDNYSIENDIVNKSTCNRILAEVFGWSKVSHTELDEICDLFEIELEKFYMAMVPIMAQILLWRRNNERAMLNDIGMSDFFSFNAGSLQIIEKPNGKANVSECIHEHCKIPYDPTKEITSVETELMQGDIYKKTTRGKFLFWFLISFCISVKKKMNVEISHKNGMTIIGNRARTPSSLRQFVNETFCNYIEMMSA